MKVIKKIAAIMFALVMVISMGANVSVAHAEEGAQLQIRYKDKSMRFIKLWS